MSATKAIVAAIAVHEAKKRVPTPPDWPGVTFFSRLDVWLYDARLDSKTCDLCRAYEDIGIFYGHSIRGIFPYLEIQDMNTIAVNVHPNCRCYLTRLLAEPEIEPEKPKFDKDLMNKAKDVFHTTTSFNRAGWILPDGSMLDFSDFPYGGLGLGRSLDHSDIVRIAPTATENPVNWFQQESGMRFAMYANQTEVAVSIDIQGEYSDVQWSKLKDAVQIGHEFFAYDIYDGDKLLKSNGIEKSSVSDVDEMRRIYLLLKTREYNK